MGDSKLNSKKSTTLKIRQYRVFSEEFKRNMVAQITSGQTSILAVCRLWEVSKESVYQWVYKYSPDHKRATTMVVQKDSEASKNIELQKKIAELERILGQKQMVIDYQDKLIEIASKELDIDIKKNFNPGP